MKAPGNRHTMACSIVPWNEKNKRAKENKPKKCDEFFNNKREMSSWLVIYPAKIHTNARVV